MTVYNFQRSERYHSSTLLSSIMLGEPATRPLGCSSSYMERCMWREPSCHPCEGASLEAYTSPNPQMTAALDCNVIRDPEPEPSSQVAPKFLAYRHDKRYKCPEAR